jgi:hypothetical protein
MLLLPEALGEVDLSRTSSRGMTKGGGRKFAGTSTASMLYSAKATNNPANRQYKG